MADELETVEQRFTADIEAYIANVDAAAKDARDFAKANTEASDAASRMRDHAETEAAALGHLRDEALAAAAAEKRLDDTSVSLRDRLTSAGDAGRTLGMRLAAASQNVSGIHDVMGAFNKDAGMGARVMAGFSAATGLLEAPMSGLIVGVGGLAAGLASAGIGVGIFGLVAKSAYSQVSGAVTAYGTALSTTGKASATAMAQYKAQMAALTPPQRAFAVAITSAQQAWQGFVAANTSGVTSILNQGMGLLPAILARMQPFLAPVEKALHGIITDLGHGLDSAGFKSFIDAMAKASGPMLTDLAGAIGHVVVGIGGILKAFLPMSSTMMGGLDKITAKFAQWGSTLTSHSGFQSLVAMAKADMPYVITIVKNLGEAIAHLGGSMTGLSTFSNSKALLQLAAPLSQILNDLTKANPDLVRFGLYLLAAHSAASKLAPVLTSIKSGFNGIQDGVTAAKNLHAGFTDADQAASEASGAWGTFGGKLSSLGEFARTAATKMGLLRTATRDGTIAQEGMDVALEANPIGIIITAVLALIAIIVLLTMHSKAFREFWKAAWGDIEAVAVAAWHFIDRNMIQPLTHGVAQLVDWVRSHWKLLATIIATVLLGPIGGLIVFVATHWNTIRTDTSRLISDVTSFFRSLPGKILSALGDLGRILFNAGASIIDGLINGLKSALGSLGSFLGSVGSFIASHKGPIDVDRVLLVPHGKAIIQGLMDGMNSRKTELQSMLTGLTGSVAGSAAQGLAAAGVGSTSAPAVHVTVPVALGAGTTGYNSPQFLQYLQGVVQEGVLRYTQVNPSNGLSVAGKLS